MCVQIYVKVHPRSSAEMNRKTGPTTLPRLTLVPAVHAEVLATTVESSASWLEPWDLEGVAEVGLEGERVEADASVILTSKGRPAESSR